MKYVKWHVYRLPPVLTVCACCTHGQQGANNCQIKCSISPLTLDNSAPCCVHGVSYTPRKERHISHGNNEPHYDLNLQFGRQKIFCFFVTSVLSRCGISLLTTLCQRHNATCIQKQNGNNNTIATTVLKLVDRLLTHRNELVGPLYIHYFIYVSDIILLMS
jgi:hypothetical protein